MDDKEPVVVYTTSDPSEAEVLRIALENEGIECFVTGENQGGFTGVLSEITLVVPPDKADDARRILESTPRTTDDTDSSEEE